MLEVMLPSAIKAKHKKYFQLYMLTQFQKNLKLSLIMASILIEAQYNDDAKSYRYSSIVSEMTLLSQNVSKKKQRAVSIIEGFDYDSILNSLEKSKNSTSSMPIC